MDILNFGKNGVVEEAGKLKQKFMFLFTLKMN